MGDRVTKQPSRLRFKRATPWREAAAKSAVEDNEKDRSNEDSTSKKPPKNLQEPVQAPKLEEWGPNINGYRFVGTKDGLRHYHKRDWLVTDTPGPSSTKDFYNWSYADLPEYHDAQIDDTLEGGLDDPPSGEDQDLSYFQYHREWELIRQEGHRGVIFPLKRTTDELTLENVENFMNTAGDYLNALKVERIRWHPDKMLYTLKIRHDSKDLSDELLEKKITTTFQIINQLWQSATTK